jgi:hypothetical protein
MTFRFESSPLFCDGLFCSIQASAFAVYVTVLSVQTAAGVGVGGTGVFVGGTGVLVAVGSAVAVAVDVLVAVGSGVFVAVGSGVFVAVGSNVGVFVGTGVSVGGTGVFVAVAVAVAVGTAVGGACSGAVANGDRLATVPHSTPVFVLLLVVTSTQAPLT